MSWDSVNCQLTNTLSNECVSSKEEHIVICLATFILIPVYRFIVYPLARKHLPSLLKMIGAGLILWLASTVVY